VQERRSLAPLIVVAAGVVVIDHATKWLALRELGDGRTVDLVWTLRLRLVHNHGAAFGLGSRFAPVIALIGVGVVLTLLRSSRRIDGWLPRLALGLVLGGAVGNLLDRLFRGGHGFLGGPVVDFVDLRWWPVFNVADVAISVGAILLAITLGAADPGPSPSPAPASPSPSERT
jgi:signal peptidase II